MHLAQQGHDFGTQGIQIGVNFFQPTWRLVLVKVACFFSLDIL